MMSRLARQANWLAGHEITAHLMNIEYLTLCTQALYELYKK